MFTDFSRAELTFAIQNWEIAHKTSFVRSDEMWFDISENEEQFIGHIKRCPKIITLMDDEYDLVFDADEIPVYWI